MRSSPASTYSRDGRSLKGEADRTTSSVIAFINIHLLLYAPARSLSRSAAEKIPGNFVQRVCPAPGGHRVRQVMQMDGKNERLRRYAQAVACLPPRLMGLALTVPDEEREETEELRLRVGQVMRRSAGGREFPVGGAPVTVDEARDTLTRAAHWSVHSFSDCLRAGFLPLVGGHRLGVCGTMAVQNGQPVGVRTVSSLCLRIAREIPGAADGILRAVYDGERVRGTLILSPPGWGKTTLLRDLIRALSEAGVRVGVADERGELAAMREGQPQFALGGACDVLDGCPKAAAALQLVRTMSPRVLALDEVTDPTDLEAVRFAANCGVAVLATIHARNAAELSSKPFYRDLCASRAFSRILVIDLLDGRRAYRALPLEGGNADA